jgi:hypothetical protein
MYRTIQPQRGRGRVSLLTLENGLLRIIWANDLKL